MLEKPFGIMVLKSGMPTSTSCMSIQHLMFTKLNLKSPYLIITKYVSYIIEFPACHHSLIIQCIYIIFVCCSCIFYLQSLLIINVNYILRHIPHWGLSHLILVLHCVFTFNKFHFISLS